MNDQVEQMLINDKALNASESAIIDQLSKMGVDTKALTACVKDPTTVKAVEAESNEVQKTGLYGTPTVFINGTAVVGPKPDRVYRRLLQNSLF